MEPRPLAGARFGVSGFDYRDWRGPLYPDPMPSDFRPLALLARFLDFVEVNVTFYRIIPPAAAERWVEETPSRFTFLFKAWQGWTHDRVEPAAEEVEAFRALLEPAAAAGRLEGVLAQFPPGLSGADEAFARLLPLRDAVGEQPLFAEFRHRALWREEVFARLEREGIGFVNVDLPPVGTLPRPSRVNTGPVGMLRLHGRNRAGWSRSVGRDERYDHRYDRRECAELVETVRELLDRCPRVLVGANNHFRAAAPAAAVMLAAELRGEPVPAPARLRAAFPELVPLTVPLPEEDGALPSRRPPRPEETDGPAERP